MFRIAPFRRRNGFGTFLPQAFSDVFNWPETSWGGFTVDVKETADGYELEADLPGVAKDNINISVDDGYLTVAVRQEDIKSENNENYIRRERRQISSQRSFYVGNINPEDVVAKHRDGVLEIKFPKATAEADNVRNIPIN
ncbi:MAG: Hsp20/alpha crystallin family protein [Firmicutes bacterium]|nr:Hsp20/alpha crystallin family protein [Bacillota bacterium]